MPLIGGENSPTRAGMAHPLAELGKLLITGGEGLDLRGNRGRTTKFCQLIARATLLARKSTSLQSLASAGATRSTAFLKGANPQLQSSSWTVVRPLFLRLVNWISQLLKFTRSLIGPVDRQPQTSQIRVRFSLV